MLGVWSGILASLAAVGFPPAVLAQFSCLAAVGGTIGTIIGRRITATELPQMVAALHSVVGLAAVFTSIASVLTDLAHISTLHLVTAYLGVLIGSNSYLNVLFYATDVSFRWDHVHRLHRSLSQACWSNAFKTISAAETTPSEQFTSWRERANHGRLPFHSTSYSTRCSRFSQRERFIKLYKRVHNHCCYRWCRYASVILFFVVYI